MNWDNALPDFRSRYTVNGEFSLLPNESINLAVKRAAVSNGRGIYIIFRRDNHREPLYIGKAGTVNADGSWKKQGLAKRLTKKQQGKTRSQFFGELMKADAQGGLTFLWFVTYEDPSGTLPALAEMQLLQAHFEQFGRLPKLNGCA